MFTGLIEEMGTVQRIRKGRSSAVIEIAANIVTQGSKLGDSIAVNGVCLTVVDINSSGFAADVMHETLNRSTLAKLSSGSRVNLERAMAADGRFGGHIVAGHVDGVGRISDIRRDDNAIWYTVQAAPSVMLYIVEKGSITIDGISLTVAALQEDRFSVSVIPHTAKVTALSERRVGDEVNLENDIVGKYIAKFVQQPAAAAEPAKSNIDRNFLAKYGF